MQQRIIGFDVARAYAIFGMFVVNFTFCFGSFNDPSLLGQSLALFVGVSTAIFIILAGMGLSLMTNRSAYTKAERLKLKSIVLRRSWFLLALGLLLFSWWPGDILHFYGGYMHIAAFLLFVPKKYYLWLGLLAIVVFHLLLPVIDINTSWDFATYKYADFWTPIGFLRNTLYNGWNSIFPWLSYFMLGMFLGRLNWEAPSVKKNVFFIACAVFLLLEGLRHLANQNMFDQFWTNYLMSEYFPAYLPFVLLTASSALIILTICMYIGKRYQTSKIITALASTGRMTLSFYVFHVTIGMIAFSMISGQVYTGYLAMQNPAQPLFIVVFVLVLFVLCVIFSVLWMRVYKHGPLESLMRRISN